MLLQIDLRADAPVFAQLADAVTAQLAAGAVQPGERLPAARDLADALGVNVHTVLHAYQRLRDEGLIELRRGRGAVVIGRTGGAELHALVRTLLTEADRAGIALNTLIALIRKEAGA